jgi:hypothetical protein
MLFRLWKAARSAAQYALIWVKALEGYLRE